MGFLAKASALFVGLRVTASYHQALQVSNSRKSSLLDARRDIRNAIRASAARIQIEDGFWEPAYAARSARSRPSIMPKFFTQGSFAYDLLVDPCHKPPQQLDLDDGMYVRVDYLENGQPALVAKTLFALVEDALRPLCRERGWILDTSKLTCVRVQLNRESHVDIPIYSAPRELAESISFGDAQIRSGQFAKRAGRLYAKLPSDQIMLAHRDGTWQQSDPLELQKWVEACVARYGEDFRRACRYFKGWRDHRWEHCCLSSITIMAAVAEALEQLNGTHRNLDDDRIAYEIAQRLPGIFRGELLNPAFPGQRIVLNDWTDDDRTTVVKASEALAADMHSALKGTANADLVVQALRRAFGERIPYRPDMVEILPTVAAAVAAEAPALVPAPKVTNSTSG
ncbi:CBASS cGAMP synthase [Sphingobium baderi]|uniref:CBASS cGAMP synthase n=1 Tax=Sphingobium baderi TaxID=1332080 RepID=UPI002B402130|nr:CBASS cGAMP synthase [Sphingobium baderi]WRD78854.1 CBASS cGAMP synthase [Sphingobium baderi]